MADEIKQELGFDASKALSTLRQLDGLMKSFNQTVGASVRALDFFNKKGGQTVAMLKRLQGDAKKTADAMGRLGKTGGIGAGTGAAATKTVADLEKVGSAAARTAAKVKDTGNAAKDTAKVWTVSWETMARVVATQAIVRALSTIRQSLKAAVRDAVAFQRAVAEIGTIGRGLGSLENIGDMVARVSDAFNVSLADTGEAVYQTISNQIAQTEKDVESFTSSAAKFSKVTKTDLATSVNLLSGTLNAFGKTVEETEDVAAKFFKTIELGRTRAEDLAQGYGTVAPIADKLGISMEELNAAVATLTINGIGTDKAFTQIRGTMQGFLKPTEEMKDAFKELGFATGEQVLATYDLQEAIEVVAGTTEGNAAAIAKLFPRIRGLTGVLALLDDEAGHFSKTLQEQKDGLEETYGTAYKLVVDTDAEKITKDLNKLKNFFTTEFGQSILKASVEMSQLIGGTTTIIALLKALVPIAAAGAVALGIYATKAIYARVATAGLTLSLRSLTGALLAVGAAVAVGTFAGNKIADLAGRAVRQLEESNKKALKLFTDAETRRLKIAEETDADRLKSARQANQSIVLDYRNSVDGVEASNDALVKHTEAALDKLVKARKKAVKELEKAAEDSADEIIASQDRVSDLRLTAADRRFERTLSGDDVRDSLAMLERGRSLASDAAKAMASATSPRDIDRAVKMFERASEVAEQAEDLAADTGNRSLLKKAADTVDSIIDRQIRSEGKLQDNQATMQAQLEKRVVQETKILEILKLQTEVIEENLSLYDDEGKAFSGDELAKRQAKLATALKGLPIEFEVRESVRLLQQQVKTAFQDFKVGLSFDTATLEALTGQTVTSPEEVFGNISQVTEEAKTLRQAFSDVTADRQKLQLLRKEVSLIDSGASTTFRSLARLVGGQTTALSSISGAVSQFREDLVNLAQSSQITDEEFGGLAGQLGKIQEISQSGLFDNLGLSLDVMDFTGALQKLGEIKALQEGLALSPASETGAAERLTQLEAFTTSLNNAQAPAAAIQQSAEATAAAWLRAAAAANSVGSATPTARHHGGVMGYFDSGGFARGLDKIPAMLSDGEHVTNAKSSRRFFSQLQSINAGVKPTFRESGGSVTNIGDVSINVRESGSPKQTAREVMQAFRREQRRGSARI